MIAEMALWIKIVLKLGKLHHANPGISLNWEIKQLIKRFLNGSLIEKDELIAEKILDHVWGDESALLLKRESGTSVVGSKGTPTKSNIVGQGEVSEETISEHFSRLKLSQNKVQIRKVKSLLYNMREGLSTILCAPTMTGKSIILQVRIKYDFWSMKIMPYIIRDTHVICKSWFIIFRTDRTSS